jgi:dipeptidyl aminopeptidase/acylaminoacyl peptidase
MTLALAIALAAHLAPQAPAQLRFVFSDGGGASLWDGKSKKKLVAEAFNLSLSRDGTTLVYEIPNSGTKRSIGIYDLVRMRRAGVLQHAAMPSVSPDGRRVAFLRYEPKTDWRAFVVHVTNLGAVVRLGGPPKGGVFGLCWSSDGASVVCQDLNTVYWLSPGGTIRSKTTVAKIAGSSDLVDSGTTFRENPVTPRLILFGASAECDEKVLGDDGMGYAAFVFDTVTGKLRRLTPKNLNAVSPCWTPNGQGILFTGYSAQSPATPWVYFMSANGGAIKRVVSGSEPTAG